MRHPRHETIAMSLAAAACLIMAGGAVWAVLAYNAFNPVPYSPLNHLFSELGWPRFSPASGVFNFCLATASILNAPLVWLLGRRLGNRWARAAAVAGLVATWACYTVGLFPLGSSPIHFRFQGVGHGMHFLVSAVFFWWWLLTMALFLVALLRSPAGRRMKPLIAATIFSLASALSFLALPHEFIFGQIARGEVVRSGVIWLAALEWLLIGTIGLWLLAAIHGLWMQREEAGE